jgi:hypothetical protein
MRGSVSCRVQDLILKLRASSSRPHCVVVHPGSRGSTNGLLRQSFPKRTNLSTVMPAQIQLALVLLTDRPRKMRYYKTSNKFFADTFVPPYQHAEIALMS